MTLINRVTLAAGGRRPRMKTVRFEPRQAIVIDAGEMKRAKPQTVVKAATEQFVETYTRANMPPGSDHEGELRLRMRIRLVSNFVSEPLGASPQQIREASVNFFVATGDLTQGAKLAQKEANLLGGAEKILWALQERGITFTQREVRLFELYGYCGPWERSRTAMQISFPAGDGFTIALIKCAIKGVAKELETRQPPWFLF